MKPEYKDFWKTVKEDSLDFDTPMPYFLGVMVSFIFVLLFIWVLDMPFVGVAFIVIEFIFLILQSNKIDEINSQ